MTEYISREEMRDALLRQNLSWEDWHKADYAVVCAPAADVRPVVRAVWRRYSPFTDTYECSNCGEQVIDQQFRTNFCPNCGADMRAKEDE